MKVKQDEYWTTVKVGRTHLQDAVPLTFGQELSGYIAALNHDLAYINELEETLYELPIGGTAVGTGLNAAQVWLKILLSVYQENMVTNLM